MNTRPETGVLAKGMTVFVERSPNDTRNRPEGQRYIEATITAVGSKLVTAEQHVWDVKQRRDAAYLREQGITLSLDSPWHGCEQVLADLVRQVGL